MFSECQITERYKLDELQCGKCFQRAVGNNQVASSGRHECDDHYRSASHNVIRNVYSHNVHIRVYLILIYD